MQQDEHKNLENWWRNAWWNWTQSWQPSKFKQQELSQFEPTLKSYFFWGWKFSTFFFNFMPQKYQNEKSPILNNQKKPKTSGKVQKIRVLEGLSSFCPFENTTHLSVANYYKRLLSWRLFSVSINKCKCDTAVTDAIGLHLCLSLYFCVTDKRIL